MAEKGDSDSKKGPSVSLVLGSGGARGLAHIGAIEVLEQRGYRIRAIAGSSMGALVGGIHALGRLNDYRDWIKGLSSSDVLGLVDWTFSGGGLIRGKRIIDQLKELVGEANIEDLPIPFTAVATDLDYEREIWLVRGPLFDAVRASIAIPGVFTPHRYLGRTLVDGGLVNPLPVAPTLKEIHDLLVVVNVNGPVERKPVAAAKAPAKGKDKPKDKEEQGMLTRLGEFLENFQINRAPKENAPGLMAVLLRSLDTVETTISRFKLSLHQPDLVIETPRDACQVHEFYRAGEQIELGRQRAEEALERFEARGGPRLSPLVE